MPEADDFRTRLQAALAANDQSALKALAAQLPHEELPVTQQGVLRRTRSLVPGTGEPTVATLFAPADERPLNYSADLPFLSQTLTNVIEFERHSQPPTLQFFHVADPTGATESLLNQSRERGWIHDSTPNDLTSAHTEWLHRGKDRRRIIVTRSPNEGMIWLMDMTAE